MVYFDCAATTKPTEKVIQDITEGMRGIGLIPLLFLKNQEK